MIQRDATVYLVFDYSDMDFKRYMDKMKREGLTAAHIKVKHNLQKKKKRSRDSPIF